MSCFKLHKQYIGNYLVEEIVGVHFGEEILHSYEVVDSAGFDGFMSAIYTIKIVTIGIGGTQMERLVLAKFMKGDSAFRQSSKSFIQFSNEVHIYSDLLQLYKNLLKAANVNSVSVSDWVPTAYIAKYGLIQGLSKELNNESVLVLQHLKPEGYTLGPRLFLTRKQLLSLCKPLGEFHALSYGLEILKPSKFKRMKKTLIPLPFIDDNDPDDTKSNVYRALYRVAFDRFYDFIDRKKEILFDTKSEKDVKLMASIKRLRDSYFTEPTLLLERLRTQVFSSPEDSYFAVILHGDYNRNNVLFRFGEYNEIATKKDEVIIDHAAGGDGPHNDIEKPSKGKPTVANAGGGDGPEQGTIETTKEDDLPDKDIVPANIKDNAVIVKHDVAKTVIKDKKDVALTEVKKDVTLAELKEDVASAEVKKDVTLVEVKEDVALAEVKEDVASAEVKEDVEIAKEDAEIPKEDSKIAKEDEVEDGDLFDVKMIDFQETRYGSPAIDLSFMMYMNISNELRDEMWTKIIEAYHNHMFSTLKKLLTMHPFSAQLERYSLERFNNHFKLYAFYGVMICMHFLPWMLSSETDCAELSHWFETDMHSEQFRKISMEAGGDDVNMKIFEIVRHACEMGYMDHI